MLNPYPELLLERDPTNTSRRQIVFPQTRQDQPLKKPCSRLGVDSRPVYNQLQRRKRLVGHLGGARLRRISRVRPFLLYSLRHTFLTSSGDSGCGAFQMRPLRTFRRKTSASSRAFFTILGSFPFSSAVS